MTLSLLLIFLLQTPAHPHFSQAGQVIEDEAKHCCPPGEDGSQNGCARASAAALPVRFTAADPNDTFDVRIAGPEGPSCRTPCELHLVPSGYKVEVTGSAKLHQRLDVAKAPMNLLIERRDELWKHVGIASLSMGGATLLVGGFYSLVVMIGTMGDRDPFAAKDPHWARERNQKLLAGLGVGTLGAMIAVGGIIGLTKSGHTRIVAAPPEITQRDEISLELVAFGAVPVEKGAQVGAAFRF